jgi:micrococcal nuclease
MQSEFKTGQALNSIITVILFFALIGLVNSIFPYMESDGPVLPHSKNDQEKDPKVLETTDENLRIRPPSEKLQEVVITRVIDGDTVEVTGGRKVRFIGIDAPESVHPNQPTACFGSESARFAQSLLEGKRVHLEKDLSETDRYKRLLRYVWLGDLLINEYLVKEGYAIASTYPPDVKYQLIFSEAQKYARENNKGMWNSCNISKDAGSVFDTNTYPFKPSELGSSPIDEWNCPKNYPIKGNASSMIYHLPSGNNYKETKPEECFTTTTDARSAGYRQSKN